MAYRFIYSLSVSLKNIDARVISKFLILRSLYLTVVGKGTLLVSWSNGASVSSSPVPLSITCQSRRRKRAAVPSGYFLLHQQWSKASICQSLSKQASSILSWKHRAWNCSFYNRHEQLPHSGGFKDVISFPSTTRSDRKTFCFRTVIQAKHYLQKAPVQAGI